MKLSFKEREAQAKAIYEQGLVNVQTRPMPLDQKFPPGTRVQSLRAQGTSGTVKYTYAHAYSGGDVKSYCIDWDNLGTVAWIDESELEAIL